MSEQTPPRRPLATFLRPSQAQDADAPAHARRADTPAEASPAHADDVEDPAAGADRDHAALDVDRRTDEAVHAGAAEDRTAPTTTVSIADGAHATGASAGTAAPVFLRPAAPPRPASRRGWIAVAGLSLLLLLQISVADRARLAADAGTRPLVTALCGVLRCSVPAWHEPAAFTMTSRDVRPVAGQAGALQVQASIRNDARWAQDWPSIRLSLSDPDGRVIGTGVFEAADYLGAAAATTAPLEPGQSARIAFQVKEPAASTVAFNFEFL